MSDICPRCQLDFEVARHGVRLVNIDIYCDECGCCTDEEEIAAYYVGEFGNDRNTIHYFQRFIPHDCPGCRGKMLGINIYCGGINVTPEIKTMAKIEKDKL